jgi:hypothetical protein
MITSTFSTFRSVVGEVAVGCPFAVAVSGRPVRAKRFSFSISLLWRPFSFPLSFAFAFSFPLRLVLDLSEPFWCVLVDLTRLGLTVHIAGTMIWLPAPVAFYFISFGLGVAIHDGETWVAFLSGCSPLIFTPFLL